MYGFYGNINGETIGDPIKFLEMLRSEDDTTDEVIGQIMNKLSISQLESGLFTKREIKQLRNIDDFNKQKLFKLTYIESDDDDEYFD